MMKELLGLIFTVFVFMFLIAGAALLLTGCEVVKYTAKCTLVQPENCN
jgi:hypothetical protein